MNSVFHLPCGWTWCEVGNLVAKIETGKSFRCEERPPLDGEIGVAKVSAVSWGFYDEDESKTCLRKEMERTELFIRSGDFLFSRANTIELVGACVIVGSVRRKIMLSDKILRLKIHPSMPGKWLLWFLRSWFGRAEIERLATGNQESMRNIGQQRIRQIRMPLAPFPEQNRIVDAIDSHITRLDDAVATLKRVQCNLKRYRASVLKAAVEGRLVPTEAELARSEKRNYEPASELLKRILVERRCRWERAELAKMKATGKPPTDDKRKSKYQEPASPDTSNLPELPPGWCWARMDVVGRVQLGRQRAPEHHNGPNMRPYLRVANVFEDHIDVTDVLKMNFEPRDVERYQLHNGDILLNEGQSPHLVGRAAMYRGEVPGACFQNTLVRFQAREGIDREYALVVFRAQLHSLRYLRIAQITTNIAHLGAERFSAIEFPLPPLAEQQRIVTAVQRQLTVIDRQENDLNAGIARCHRLRQSILKWAFEGKLVDQDPADGLATVLLDRIQPERAANETPKERRRPRRAARTA